MALDDATIQSIEQTTQKLRKVGKPQKQRDWLVVISVLTAVPNEGIEEFQRQGRIHGVDWLVRVTDVFLTEIAAGNTFRDQQGVLRLAKPSDGLKSLITS
jgi:hypothetical protein